MKAGVIAAPCIIALNTMVDRLIEDHRAASRLAEAVREAGDLRLACPVATNQLRIDTAQVAPAAVLGDHFGKGSV